MNHPPAQSWASRLAGRAALLVTFALAGAALVVGPPASADAHNASPTGWVRVGHLSPGTAAVDIAVTPLAGGGTRVFRDVKFQDVTRYASVPTGTYSVAFRPTGSPMSVTPMIRKSLRVGPKSATSVFATGKAKNVAVQVIYDDLRPPPPGDAKVRLVSGTASRNVSVRAQGGPVLARRVTPGSATGYAPVHAQTWTLHLRSGTDTAQTDLTVRAGSVYTIVALDREGGGVRLEGVEDSAGAARLPTGGVDTGGGGLATERVPGRGQTSVSDVVPGTLLLGGGALLVLLAAAWTRRPRRR